MHLERVSFERFKSLRYLYNNMADCLPNQAEECLYKSHELMSHEPENSVYVLANVKGIRFNKDIIQVFKDVTKKNAPYVKTTAVYGLDGFAKLLINTVVKFSRREMRVFDDLDQAKEWLLAQQQQQVSMAV